MSTFVGNDHVRSDGGNFSANQTYTVAVSSERLIALAILHTTLLGGCTPATSYLVGEAAGPQSPEMRQPVSAEMFGCCTTEYGLRSRRKKRPRPQAGVRTQLCAVQIYKPKFKDGVSTQTGKRTTRTTVKTGRQLCKTEQALLNKQWRNLTAKPAVSVSSQTKDRISFSALHVAGRMSVKTPAQYPGKDAGGR
jgi:hypothetical protein